MNSKTLYKKDFVLSHRNMIIVQSTCMRWTAPWLLSSLLYIMPLLYVYTI